MAWAILRAFHGATASASTAAQIRGSRCWRSRASANNCNPDRVDTPSAAANGSGVNAATNGVPSPPRAASWSGHTPGRPVSDQVTNPDSAVAGCSTHHRAAARSLARPAWRSRTSASAAKSSSHCASRLETSTRLPFNIVSNMTQSKQPAPTFRPRNRCWNEGLWRSIFEEFLQPCLGFGGLVACWRFQTNTLRQTLEIEATCVAGSPSSRISGSSETRIGKALGVRIIGAWRGCVLKTGPRLWEKAIEACAVAPRERRSRTWLGRRRRFRKVPWSRPRRRTLDRVYGLCAAQRVVRPTLNSEEPAIAATSCLRTAPCPRAAPSGPTLHPDRPLPSHHP